MFENYMKKKQLQANIKGLHDYLETRLAEVDLIHNTARDLSLPGYEGRHATENQETLDCLTQVRDDLATLYRGSRYLPLDEMISLYDEFAADANERLQRIAGPAYAQLPTQDKPKRYAR